MAKSFPNLVEIIILWIYEVNGTHAQKNPENHTYAHHNQIGQNS